MKCSKCKQDKPEKDFYKAKERARGFRSKCKDCEKVQNKKYHQTPEYRAKDIQRKRDNPEKTLLNATKVRARMRGLDHNLDISDVKIPEICPMLGIPLFISGKRFTQNSPTVDRIDNSVGYIKGNAVVCSFRANSLKKDATVDELERIVVWLRQHEQKTLHP